jgi:hypothetical protein
MSETSRIENAQITREARDAVTARPRGSSAAAIEAAMRRYLSAEQYHELHEREQPSDEETKPV